jgi:hypothetical protein
MGEAEGGDAAENICGTEVLSLPPVTIHAAALEKLLSTFIFSFGSRGKNWLIGKICPLRIRRWLCWPSLTH